MVVSEKKLIQISLDLTKAGRKVYGIGDLYAFIRPYGIIENWQIKGVVVYLENKGIVKQIDGLTWEVIKK